MSKYYPPLPTKVGNCGKFKDRKGDIQHFTILDEVKRIQSSAPHKALYLQLLQFEKDGRKELRLAYYIIGIKPRMKGAWTWGQYATLMPAKDFKAIIRKATKKGWI